MTERKTSSAQRPPKDAFRLRRWEPLLWFALSLLASGYMLLNRV
jgi:hypothetical protein